MDRPAVLITGASGGLGQALCDRFSRAGYFVVATDRSSYKGSGDAYIQADLLSLIQSPQAGEQLCEQVLNELAGRPLKALVNNAAVQHVAAFEELKLADMLETVDVNFAVPMLLSRIFLSQLETAQGAIINIGSIHAKLTKRGFVSYAATKAALQGLTRALAVELGGRVRVNIIQPAAVDTGMLRAGFANQLEALRHLGGYHPAGRIALPEEIAGVAVFLASEAASFITGATIDLDGGIGSRLHDPS